MRRILYDKSKGGHVVVDEVVNLSPTSAIEKVDLLFDLLGMSGWEKPLPELIELFMRAIDELVVINAKRREELIAFHNGRFWLIRALRNLAGYQEPPPVTREEITAHMADKLARFSAWAKKSQYRRFYMGSNMKPVIEQPLRVADALQDATIDPPYRSVGDSAYSNDS